jgi:hypothetical protein
MATVAVFVIMTGTSVWAANGTNTATDTGVSGIWVLANISYAGMRAQDSLSRGWRVIAFIFGFPGSLISYFAVTEGSNRAYGIDLPKRNDDRR